MDNAYEGVAKAVIERIIDPAIKRLSAEIVKEWEKLKIDYDIAFTKYLKNTFDKYSRIKTVLYRAEPRYIYDFFEVPFLKKENSAPFKADSVNTVLDLSHFVIIQGGGGTGKSTLLKHLFISELNQKDLIPIYIELKDINGIENDVYDIQEIIYERLVSLGSSLKKEYIDYALKEGAFLFFFDGYDEIVSDKRSSFFRELDQFIDKYTDNYYIISSRPYSEFIEFQRFTVLECCKLSKEQALSLVEKIDYDNSIKARFIEELEKTLYTEYKSFASNPLLLNIMLLTYDNYAEIPRKLHIFYANAFETLYSKHDATKAGYKREMKCRLPRDSFVRIFSGFCFISYSQGTIEFSKDDLRGILKKVPSQGISYNIDDYIYDLVNSVCVLYIEGLNYKFVHRSFQEYFTAYFLKELPDKLMNQIGIQLIKRDKIRAAQDNVLCMLRDMAQERFEQNILLYLLDEVEQGVGEKEKYELYLKNTINGVGIDSTIENSQIYVYMRVTNEDSLFTVIHTISRFFYTTLIERDYSIANNKLKEYLEIDGDEHDTDEPIELYASVSRIIEDTNLSAIVEETWVGSYFKQLSQLSKTLRDNQNIREVDLTNLLIE